MDRTREEDGRAAKRGATRPAIEFDKRWIAWGEMRALAGQMNALIAASGAPHRCPIALLCRNRPPSNAELEAHLREHVPATHIPTQWRLVPDLPKNASMKFDRPAVRRLFDGNVASAAEHRGKGG